MPTPARAPARKKAAAPAKKPRPEPVGPWPEPVATRQPPVAPWPAPEPPAPPVAAQTARPAMPTDVVAAIVFFAVATLAAIFVPGLVFEAHDLIDQRTPDPDPAFTLLAMTVLAGGVCAGAAWFFVPAYRGTAIGIAALSAIPLGAWLYNMFSDYGDLGGFGLGVSLMVFGLPAAITAIIIFILGTVRESRKMMAAGVAIVVGWFLSWSYASAAVLANLDNEVEAARIANAPRSPGLAVVGLVVVLVACAMAYRRRQS